jgi:type IV pilus assembly protein PilC
MQTFLYTARDSAGQAQSGTLVADSIQEVSQRLRAEGKYPVSVRPAPLEDVAAASTLSGDAGIKIKRTELIHLSTQLAVMIETGVTLSEALDCIAKQGGSPNFQKLVADLSTQVQSGSDFSSALARHPKSFPRLYIALIKASERSGMLSKLLVRATDYLRDEQETMRRVKGALTYPAIMLAFASTTTIFLLAFVLPRFTAIYAQKAAALPLPTKLLMNASTALTTHWMIVLSVVITLALGTYFYLRTESGQRVFHLLQLRAPIFGAMYRKLYLSRGLRMLGTMSGAGVSLVDAVITTRELCGNTYFRELWDQVSDQIQAGKQLSEPMFQNSLVPRGVAQMLHSGEKGGRLAHVMEQVATYSEAELKETIAQMTRYIEPLMIVIMGLIIGGVALALMLPIFTISRVVAQ